MKLIKRYSNRRLYDVDSSRTITQTELAAMVKSGAEIKIVENKSNKDVTVEVLGRVMAAQATDWEDVKESTDFLTNMIKLGGDKSMSVLKNTVLASIGAFNVTKAKAEQIIDELIKKGDLDKSDRKQAVMEMLEKAEKSTSQLKEKISKGADKTQVEVKKAVNSLNIAKATDVKKLEDKVDKLTKALKKIEKKLSEL